VTHTYAGIGRPCWHVYTLPDWAPPDAACPICGAAKPYLAFPWPRPRFWIFSAYDESGGPFPQSPPHPMGIAGAIKANELKRAGWLESTLEFSDGEHVWGRLGDDREYTLEGAYEAAFGQKSQ
jgi:hypothetical protein